MNIPQDIRQYLEDILQEAGMLTLDTESREKILEELYLQLDNYIASLIVKNLQPEDLEKFIKMNEAKESKEVIERFINEKIPDVQQVFTNAFIDFKKLYLENVETARNNQSNGQ